MTNLKFFLPDESCDEAVREWIEIEIHKQIPLHGGVSGASVYFVEAEIGFPGLRTELKPKPLEFVIKFSSKEGFEKEKIIYDSIPQDLQKWFIDIATVRTIVDGNFFMIMPFLKKHKPLSHFIYHKNISQGKNYLKHVIDILEKIHFHQYSSGQPTKFNGFGILLNDYLSDIQRSLSDDTIIRISSEFKTNQFTVNNQTFQEPSKYFEQLLKIANEITPCFPTWVHGDCHSRNILLREKDMDLKFIDIDLLQNQGDYIYDYGTLVADLEIYNLVLQTRRPDFSFNKKSDDVFSYSLPNKPVITAAIDFLESCLEKTAQKYGDKNWKKRFLLSKARYLLKMSTKTIDPEKALIVYCEGVKALESIFKQ